MPNAYPVYHKAKKAAIEKARNTKYVFLGKGELTQIESCVFEFGYKYRCKSEHLAEQLARIDEPVTLLQFGSNEKLDFIGEDTLANAHALQIIDCCNSGFNKLPALPQTLRVLNCSHNKLTELPPLPANLLYLNCTCNNLTKLPSLPEGLKQLYCGGNNLTEIPPLPSTLTVFRWYGNKLTYLPDLPKGLTSFFLPGNWVHNYTHNIWRFVYEPQILENYPGLSDILPNNPDAIIEYVNSRNRELGR